MNRTWLIVGGVVVLGVLVFLVYRQSQKEAESYKPKPPVELPAVAVTDDIDKVSIKDGKKDEFVFERKGGAPAAGDAGAGGEWVMVKPVSATANQQALKDVVANLKQLKLDRQVDIKLDDQVRKDKHLDADQATKIVVWKGADKKGELTFGANNLVIIASQPDKVFATKGTGEGAYQAWTFQKDMKGWRNTEIWRADEPNVVNVEIKNKNGDFSFTRGDKGWAATHKGKPIERFDEAKVKDMLTNLQSLNADDFADGKAPADTGLDNPEGTVTLTLKDGAGKKTLKVGKISTGDSRYAEAEGNPTVFVISKWTAQDWVLADVGKFQKTIVDAGAGDAAASGASASKDKPKPPPPELHDPHGH